MTRALLAALLALPLLAATRAAAPDHRTVAYSLSPVLERGALVALAVEIRLRGDADGVTVLELPDRWASASELRRGVHDFTVEGAEAVTAPAPALREIKAVRNASLVVRYRVISGASRELNMREVQPFKVHLTPDWLAPRSRRA